MKRLYTTFLMLFVYSLVVGQYKGVYFDEEKLVFGENQPLPAATHIMLQGAVKEHIGLVELDVLEARGRDKRLPLYTNRWKRPKDNKEPKFLLPINYKLRSSSQFDFHLKYYAPIAKAEKALLSKALHKHLNLYLEQVIGVKQNSISLEQNDRQIMRSLNKIVHKGLEMYRNRTEIDFEGFSDLVKFKLKQISTTKLSKGKFLFKDESKGDAKHSYRTKLVSELKGMIASEIEQYLNLEWFKLVDSKYIDNYSTEKGKRTIAIQAGFGGAYLSGGTNNLSFGGSPFLGFAFPLSKRATKSKVLNNLSVTLGVFLMDFQGANNTFISGPIFKRPTYVGLSYKLFRFIHINVGATFLENASTSGQLAGIENRVFIRPFLGVSAQVDLWMDFSK